MVRIDKLVKLEKESKVDLRYCEYIADMENLEENKRIRILEDNGKFYYHEMQNGEVVKCFELALSWKPFGEFYVFNFTPDNLHVYEIETRNLGKFEAKPLEEYQIVEGMKCSYNGMTVEYEAENSLKLNGKSVEVVEDGEFILKLLKTKIRALGGAKRLYIFLENIAEESKNNSYPLFSTYWGKVKTMYAE